MQIDDLTNVKLLLVDWSCLRMSYYCSRGLEDSYIRAFRRLFGGDGLLTRLLLSLGIGGSRGLLLLCRSLIELLLVWTIEVVVAGMALFR